MHVTDRQQQTSDFPQLSVHGGLPVAAAASKKVKGFDGVGGADGRGCGIDERAGRYELG
jgi:hypothetical protein